MKNLSYYHWMIAIFAALVSHGALAMTWAVPEPPRNEKLAGTPIEVVGSLADFSKQQQAVEETVEEALEEPIEETVEEIIEPVEEVQELKPVVETPIAEQNLQELKPVEQAVLTAQIPKTTPKEKSPDPKIKIQKKVKKAKKKRKKQRATKNIAAARKGGGAKGKQSKKAGKAVLSNYRGRVQSHLARHKRNPGRGLKGKTVVRFVITRSGKVTGVRLVRRSGKKALDRATLSMIRSASPFPPIPKGGPKRMSFTVPVNYR